MDAPALVVLAMLCGRKALDGISRLGQLNGAPLAHLLGFRRGKTLRGSRDGELPAQHLVAAYAAQHRAVLRQIRVDAKTNEHKAALELLGLIPGQRNMA